MNKRWILLFVQGLGSGRSPIAPGTCGTALGVVLWWPMQALPVWVYWLLLVAVFMLALPAVARAERWLGEKDAPSIVIDEMVAYWMVMGLIPSQGLNALWGFVLFRLFDITKPWPIRWLERRCPGALGVMADDLMAGLYAVALYYLLAFLMP